MPVWQQQGRLDADVNNRNERMKCLRLTNTLLVVLWVGLSGLEVVFGCIREVLLGLLGLRRGYLPGFQMMVA